MTYKELASKYLIDQRFCVFHFECKTLNSDLKQGLRIRSIRKKNHIRLVCLHVLMSLVCTNCAISNAVLKLGHFLCAKNRVKINESCLKDLSICMNLPFSI